jgi:16S rRNA U516 pseudouridylate synthase RsuA-like enzyme
VLVYPNLGEPISKSDPALILFLAVTGVHGETPSAALEVLRDGTTINTRPLRFDPPSQNRIQQLWRVPLDTLLPGEQTLRVTVAGSQARQIREVPIAVVD